MKGLLGVATVLLGLLTGVSGWAKETGSPDSAPKAGSPESAAKTAMVAMKKGDWGAYTHGMHPEALAKAKEMFGAVVANDASGRVGQLFFGVQSPGAFDALSDSASFVAFMTNLTREFPMFGEVMRTAEFDVIGTLREGAELAHIVYRAGAKAEDLAITKTAVLTMRRHGNEWRMLLAANIEGLASRLPQLTGSKQ